MSTVSARLKTALAVGCALAALALFTGDTLQAPRHMPTVAPQQAAVRPHSGQPTNGYAYGYGTYYVALRRTVPPSWGDARNWYRNAQASGYAVGTTPMRGAIAWTDKTLYGHVALVEDIDGDYVVISDMYYDGNWNRVTFRTVRADTFLYIY